VDGAAKLKGFYFLGQAGGLYCLDFLKTPTSDPRLSSINSYIDPSLEFETKSRKLSGMAEYQDRARSANNLDESETLEFGIETRYQRSMIERQSQDATSSDSLVRPL